MSRLDLAAGELQQLVRDVNWRLTATQEYVETPLRTTSAAAGAPRKAAADRGHAKHPRAAKLPGSPRSDARVPGL